LLSDNPDLFPEATDICPIDVRTYIVDEEINAILPRGSCSATLIEKVVGVNPPFVEECGLQYIAPTFNEKNCDGDGIGDSDDSDENGDDDDDDGGDDDDDDDDDEEESCTDKSNFGFRGNEEKDCDWVATNTDDRCKKKIKKSGKTRVFEICRMTCGDCESNEEDSGSNEDEDEDEEDSNSNEDELDCKDDDFGFKGNDDKNCDWVRRKIEKKGLIFCNKRVNKKNEKIKDFCKMTCERCGIDI